MRYFTQKLEFVSNILWMIVSFFKLATDPIKFHMFDNICTVFDTVLA